MKYSTTSSTSSVDVLILGAGWTSTFLLPLLSKHSIKHAETSTTGREGTVKFLFDPDSSNLEAYKKLPSARTVLVTFPLKGKGQSKTITHLYREVHGQENGWIQLGSTGIFTAKEWNNDSSSYDKSNDRAIAEDELLRIIGHKGCVLNLAGLYGGQRDPKNWVTRVAKSKEDVKRKQAVHFVHGEDVARAILLVHWKWDKVGGKRWIICDTRVYDWWDLFMSYGAEVRAKQLERGEEGIDVAEDIQGDGQYQYERWVGEFMVAEGIKALPRPMDVLGRKLDGRGFWDAVGFWPKHPRVG